MQFKMEIPVTPLVKKWLQQKYGTVPNLSTKNSLGIVLTNMINKHNTKQDAEIRMEMFKERIVIKLSADIFFRYGHTLPPTSVCHLNKVVMEEIYSIMFYGIDLEMKIHPKRLIKDAIDRFCEFHNFEEEEFSYERAKKAYYRYRDAKGMVVVTV